MRFQVRQKVFSLSDTYTITDMRDNPVFQVKGHIFSLGNKLDLLDMAGNIVAHIQQRLLSFVNEYDISRNGQIRAIVKEELFSFFQPRFTVSGPGGIYEMEGDWNNWNYIITAAGQPVAQISKQFSLFQDSYGVDIAEEADVPTILCLVIVMDEVAHPDQNQ